jgi:hypothetical protein
MLQDNSENTVNAHNSLEFLNAGGSDRPSSHTLLDAGAKVFGRLDDVGQLVGHSGHFEGVSGFADLRFRCMNDTFETLDRNLGAIFTGMTSERRHLLIDLFNFRWIILLS